MTNKRGVALPCARKISFTRQVQLRTQPRACRQAHQPVHAELIYLAALDVGDACLSDTQHLRGFHLRHVGAGEPAIEPLEQGGTEFQLCCLYLGKQIAENTAPRWRHVARSMFSLRTLFHGFTSSRCPSLR